MDPVLVSGSLVRGRYRTLRIAWPTAAGPAWHARDTVLDRDVLVLTLAPDLARHAEARDALVGAAMRAATLVDAHIAQVYDCGDDPPYLVSEMPAAGRLAERIADKPLPLRDAARIVGDVAHALRVLHERGMAHGAIAPAWIGLDEEGRAKLLGAALVDVAMVAAAIRATEPDPPLQPRGYPEPETDAFAADVRSLAALAFHMLVGKPPVQGTALPRATPPTVAAAIERGLRGEAELRGLAAAFEPHAAPAGPREREPGFLRTEGRWLAGVLLAIAAAVGLAVGGLALVKSTSASRARPSASSPPTAAPLEVVAVRDFDPLGDGSEHSQQTPLAVDGKPQTAWYSVGYATADLGGAKAGVGLLFDLGASQHPARVRVLSPFAGWQAEWRVADRESTSVDGYRVVATFSATEEATVPLDARAEGRFWLLWITRLTDTQDSSGLPYKAAVAEVGFQAR